MFFPQEGFLQTAQNLINHFVSFFSVQILAYIVELAKIPDGW